MTPQHTPGPWKCVPTSHHYHDYRLFTPNGLIPFERGNGVEYANAKLIAAAPELLDALVSVHRELRKSGWDMAQINAALNKAGIPAGEPT